jgi:hypothetical protein
MAIKAKIMFKMGVVFEMRNFPQWHRGNTCPPIVLVMAALKVS